MRYMDKYNVFTYLQYHCGDSKWGENNFISF